MGLPENIQYLEFTRSDGDSRTWPSNVVRTIDGDGHVNFMQYVDLDAAAALRWRIAAGSGAAIALELPSVFRPVTPPLYALNHLHILSWAKLRSQVLARRLSTF